MIDAGPAMWLAFLHLCSTTWSHVLDSVGFSQGKEICHASTFKCASTSTCPVSTMLAQWPRSPLGSINLGGSGGLPLAGSWGCEPGLLCSLKGSESMVKCR